MRLFVIQLLIIVLSALLLAGCASKPPPAPVPAARRQVQSEAESAAKLTQNQNWSAAAREWQRVADHFRTLNDRTNEAIALHNVGQAQTELGQYTSARNKLLEAAALNHEMGRTNAWWRNQIALLQVEDLSEQIEPLEQRFRQLQGQFLPSSELRGLFLNELAQWQIRKTQYQEAHESLNQAERAFTQSGLRDGVAAVQANRAQLLMAQQNYPAALREWERALTAFETMALPEGIARCLAGQGRTLLLANQNMPAAEEYLTRAAQNYRTLGKPEGRVAALRSLLLCVLAQQKPAQAVQEELAQAHEDWASVLEQSQRLNEAREHWQAAASIWQTLQNTPGLQRATEGVKRSTPNEKGTPPASS